MSRNLDDLHPWVAAKARAFVAEARAIGVPVLITRTITTQEVQHALYSIGRTPLTEHQAQLLREEGLYPAEEKAGKTVTNAQDARHTAHGPPGLAFDCVPLRESGQVWWDAPDSIWLKLYRVAEKVGLDALGDPWGECLSYDKGHFQEPGWKLIHTIHEGGSR